MKMKKSLVALCLSCRLMACVPAVSFADVNFRAAEHLCRAVDSGLRVAAVDLDSGRSIQNADDKARRAGQTLSVPVSAGPVAAYSVPANIGELNITLTSEVEKQTAVYAPNVLILTKI